MIARLLRSVAAVGAVWMLGAGIASAQAPVVTATVANATFTFNWSATAGATGYSLDAGFASGNYPFRVPLGSVTSFSTAALNGVFFARIVAHTPGGDVGSNEVTFRFPTPPSAPTDLVVARNGTGFVASWAPGAGGTAPDGYQIQFGMTPGTTLVALPASTNAWGFQGVPVGTYYARVVALNGVGVSSPSNEVAVTMPVGGACDAATSDFSAGSFGGLISVSRTVIPGVAVLVNASLNGALLAANVPIAGGASLGYVGTGQYTGTVPPTGTYTMTGRTVFACGSQSSRTVTFTNDGSAGPGPRTPNPAAGQLLPVPGYLLTIVNRVANRRPDLLRASCAEHGGNNRFLFDVVRELRTLDSRWGLNVKRGYQGMSQDVIAYNRSALQDEGATTGPTGATRNISVYDVIAGHCGSNPGPWVSDVTGATLSTNDTRAVWTLAPYVNAGYKP